jgi:hypothetical protein
MQGDGLDREAKMDDVAVFDDVVFAFQAQLARFFALEFAAVNDEIVVGYHFGANKTALDIAMDFSRRPFGNGSLSHGPCADFIFTGRKETYQIQEPVGRVYKPVARRLLDANLFEKCHPVAVVEQGDFHFYFAAESESVQTASLQFFLVGRIKWFPGFFISLIEYDQHGLAAEKAKAGG